MTDRIPGAPGQYKATVLPVEFDKMQSGEEFNLTIFRDDHPVVEGTPYSKVAVLPDELAAQICPELEDPTPADAFRALHERIYPVGSIYLSVLATDPSILFGGVWEQLQDRFLLGASATYSAGQTGGEAAHALTNEEMPVHTHNISQNGSGLIAGWSNNLDTTGGSTGALFIDYGTGMVADKTGGGQPHNNMPPYLAVYMWKRVA